MSTELAWAAGFFEGEGSLGWYKRGLGMRFQLSVIQCGEAAPQILGRFTEAVGLGKVNGPYHYETRFGSEQPRYTVQYYGAKAHNVLLLLRPFLRDFSPKLQKYNVGRDA